MGLIVARSGRISTIDGMGISQQNNFATPQKLWISTITFNGKSNQNPGATTSLDKPPSQTKQQPDMVSFSGWQAQPA